MEMSVSKLLEMQKALKDRRRQLEDLLKETSTETSWRDMSQKEKRPVYQVVKVDEKLVKINSALFEIAAEIKQANAQTKIEVAVDFQDLMSPISPVVP
jgi:phosphoribosylaminoimidazole-succinocarboxamide synthase